MLCPECDGKTKVINTRHRGKLFRRRECVECGYRFNTYEVDQMMLLNMFDEHLTDKEVDRISNVLEKEFPI